MMRALNCILVGTMTFGGTGCASRPKVDTSSPMELDTGAGPVPGRYEQNGVAIDESDMVSQLKHEPASASDARCVASWILVAGICRRHCDRPLSVVGSDVESVTVRA